MKEVLVYGFRTKYEDDANEGVKYLMYDLQKEEASVFFEQAKFKKYAEFEDDQERQYTLLYNQDNTFTLIKRG